MLKRLNRRSGNRYTLFSIMLIILMLYAFNLSMRGTEKSYPEYVYYNEMKYEYAQTVRGSSLKFVRKYGKNYQGYMLLLSRSEKNHSVPEKIYIYEGWRTYREYQRAD